MRAKSIFISLLIVLGISFLGLQFLQMEYEAMGVRALAMIVLTTYYFVRTSKKSKLFFLFLLVFTVADISNFLTWHQIEIVNGSVDYYFYTINSLYIVSYLILIMRILRFWDFRIITQAFKYQLLLLLILNVFFVYMVTITTSKHLILSEISISALYNFVIMALLSVALINYMYHDDNKSMNLLIGGIFIVFAEVIQLTYFYISEAQLLNIIYSLFLVVAFAFFYLQSQMAYREKIDYLGEKIKV